jgi:hypothetical protein
MSLIASQAKRKGVASVNIHGARLLSCRRPPTDDETDDGADDK